MEMLKIPSRHDKPLCSVKIGTEDPTEFFLNFITESTTKEFFTMISFEGRNVLIAKELYIKHGRKNIISQEGIQSLFGCVQEKRANYLKSGSLIDYWFKTDSRDPKQKKRNYGVFSRLNTIVVPFDVLPPVLLEALLTKVNDIGNFHVGPESDIKSCIQEYYDGEYTDLTSDETDMKSIVKNSINKLTPLAMKDIYVVIQNRIEQDGKKTSKAGSNSPSGSTSSGVSPKSDNGSPTTPVSLKQSESNLSTINEEDETFKTPEKTVASNKGESSPFVFK
jgi:hypothetical protein